MTRRINIKSIARSYFLLVIDLLLIVIALLIYLYLVYPYSIKGPYYHVKRPLVWSFILIVIWIGFSYVFGLYKNSTKSLDLVKIYSTTFLVTICTGFTYLFIPFISPALPQNRFPAFLLLGLMIILLSVWRAFYSKFLVHPIVETRAIVIGYSALAKEFVDTFKYNTEMQHEYGYKIFGFISDEENIGKTYKDLRVLASYSKLPIYVRRLKIDQVVVVSNDISQAVMTEAIMQCKALGVEVAYSNYLKEKAMGMVQVWKKDGKYYLSYDYQSEPGDRLYLLLNRAFNFVLGILGSIMMFFAIPLVWLINLLFNKGPLFYNQERVGKNGKQFTIYKFRSMVVDAEKKSGPQYAQVKDARITRFGKIMRKSRVDELPQFINILKGDMNLVGPRPERKVFVDKLTETIPFFSMRHLVKPGLTGWAQVEHQYAGDDETSLVKLQHDLYYIKYRSFLLDLKIILRTFGVVVKLKGI